MFIMMLVRISIITYKNRKSFKSTTMKDGQNSQPLRIHFLFPLFLFYTIITQFLYGKTFFAVTEVGGKNKPTHSHFYRINPPVFPKGYSKCSLQKLANSSSVTYRGNVEILRPFFLKIYCIGYFNTL
jgi:hypothetical protein